MAIDSYSAFNDAVWGVARGLAAAATRAGDRIAIHMLNRQLQRLVRLRPPVLAHPRFGRPLPPYLKQHLPPEK